MKLARLALALGTLLVSMPPAHAQTPAPSPANPLEAIAETLTKFQTRIKPATSDDKVREASIDLSVPKAPAFTALGITPESVVRPTSPKAFATSLLSGSDPRGNIQTGLAVETAPYLLYAGNNITLRDYIANYPIRLASRTQLSVATAKGTNDEDEATRIALGFLITPFDLGDPRTDKKLLECFKEDIGLIHEKAVAFQNEIAPLVATVPPSPEWPTKLASKVAELEAEARGKAEACREKARERNWNASAWTIGVAPTWTSRDGNTSNLNWSGVSLWTSLGYGFENIPGLEDTAQILVHGRYRRNELAADPTRKGSFLEQDTLTLAAQVRVVGFSFRQTTGGPDLNFLFEAAYVREDRQQPRRRDETLFRYTVGFEYRITEGLYLDVSIGTEDGRKEGGNSQFGMASLKWAFSDKPTRNVK